MGKTLGARLLSFCAFWLLVLPAGATEVRLLEAHADALRARVELIRAARETLDVSTFIIESDRIGLGIAAELRQAARRGVRVRLLLDAGYNRLGKRVVGHLVEEGVEVLEYHPFRWHRPLWITRRMHDKVLLADREDLILGGRNISEPYYGLGSKTYVDRDVHVGPSEAARDAALYLDELIASVHVVPAATGDYDPLWRTRLDCSTRISGRARCSAGRRRALAGIAWAEGRLDAAAAEFVGLDLLHQGWQSEVRQVERVLFVADVVGAKASAPGTAHALRELMRSADRSVIIESPYLVPSRAFRRLLEKRLADGLSVRILTNSLNTTDNLWPQAGYVGCKRWLGRQGVDLWEQIGRHTLHSKSAVFDDEVAVIGSFNLDPRSEKLNREVLVVIHDLGLAGDLVESMSRGLQRAWRIDETGRPEGHGEKYPGIGRWKRVQLHLLRLLTPMLRKQL